MSNPNTETLKRDLQALIDDARVLFNDSSEVGAQNSEALRQRGATLIRQSAEKLRALEQSAVTKGRQVASDTNHFVHEKPWTAVGLSAGVGILIGMLISRR